MADARVEIEKLYNSLVSKGLSSGDADYRCNLAADEIGKGIYDAVVDALQEAAEMGMEARVREFLDQLGVSYNGSSITVGATSGKTDFSTPPMPMLPYMLKTAKFSKKGVAYKVIPMGDQESSSGDKPIADVSMFIQDLDQARRSLRDRKADRRGRSIDPVSEAKDLALGITLKTRPESKNLARVEANEYRTATSQQDPNRMWVRPGKDANFTDRLNEINRKLADQVEFTIFTVIRSYEES